MGTDMIPTRRKVGRKQVEVVAGHLAGTLMAGWGLANASLIAGELRRRLKAEKAKRKEEA